VLARHGAPPTGDDKTSFCFAFTTADRAGTLAGALMELAKAGISMTKVESRPSRMLLGQYIFRRLRSDDAREGAAPRNQRSAATSADRRTQTGVARRRQLPIQAAAGATWCSKGRAVPGGPVQP